MVVPSRSVASTFVGSCACSLGSAVRKCESSPEGLSGLLEGLLRQLLTVAQSTHYPKMFAVP